MLVISFREDSVFMLFTLCLFWLGSLSFRMFVFRLDVKVSSLT